MDKRLFGVVLLATCIAAGCATTDRQAGRVPHASAEPSMSTMLAPIARADSDGLRSSLAVIGATGMSGPHDPGASRRLSDADLYNISGDGPERAIWFSVKNEPCYTIKDAQRDLGGTFRKHGEESYRRENQAFLVSARMSKNDVNCIGHVMIVKR